MAKDSRFKKHCGTWIWRIKNGISLESCSEGNPYTNKSNEKERDCL